MKKKLKEIAKTKKTLNEPLLMDDDLADDYPEIEGNLSNFVDDYVEIHESIDRLASFNYGERVFEFEDVEDFPGVWNDVTNAIVYEHFQEWARLYYALSLQYNPIWNVDGTVTNEYGATLQTNTIGERNTTNVFGEVETEMTTGDHVVTAETEDHVIKSDNAARTNTSTDYDVTYDSASRKETGYNSSTLGGALDTTTAEGYTDTTTAEGYTDTNTVKTHTDTVKNASVVDTIGNAIHTDTITRSGNIGVTMTQQMLDAEWQFRQKSFFKMIMETIFEEVGLYYD